MNNQPELIEFASLQLPHQHRPEADLMSKLILLDPQVVNIVVNTTLSSNAISKYSTEPTV